MCNVVHLGDGLFCSSVGIFIPQFAGCTNGGRLIASYSVR